jgi:hypothetical protein
MGITVLFPEFMFSKAICELRLALADLYDMHVALKNANLEWTDTKVLYDEKIILKWTWHADFGRGMRFMYWLLGLRQPTLAESEQPVAVQQTGSNHGSSSIPPVAVERDESEPGLGRSSASVVSILASDIEGSGQKGKDNASRASEALGHQSHVGQLKKPASTNAPRGQATEVITASQREDGDNYPPATDVKSAAQGQDQLGGESNRSASQSVASQESLMRHRPRSLKPLREVTWPKRRREWTLVHSFYVNMGGLLCRGSLSDTDTYPIMANTLVNTLNNKSDMDHLKLLDLSKADIEDKSKADWLLKAIAVTQITWLIMNVWARAVTHLPVTQLEIATVAFSLMAIATYASCWWKPKDVGQPTLLTRLPGSMAADNKRCFQSFFRRLLVPSESEYLIQDLDRPRIHNDTIWMEGKPPMPQVMLVLMALSSIAFGGLHFLAWNFEFPSEAELVLWRVACITSAILPVISLGLTFFINILATSFIKNRHLASVVSRLAPLSRIPDQYWLLMGQEPSCLKWSRESWFNFRTMLEQKTPGDPPSDWDKEPAPHLPTDAPPQAEDIVWHDLWALRGSWEYLQEFAISWMSISSSTGKRSLPSDRYLLDSVTWIGIGIKNWGISHSRQVRDYEAFLRTKLDGPVPESAPLCVLDFIASLRPAVEALNEKREAFKKSCNRASRIVTIGASILYAASRIVILVLIFTSLRAVPEGVYKNTPWTRFLPNIS